MVLLKDRFRTEGGGSVLEDKDGTTERAQVAASPLGSNAQSDTLKSLNRDELCIPEMMQEVRTSVLPDVEGAVPTSVPGTRRDPDTLPPRDLVDTYFREMGGAEPLSRGDEIALAKRIEADERALLMELCRVPIIVEHIVRWGQEVAEGRRRLASIFDPSATEEGSKAAARPDLSHYVDSPRTPTRRGGSRWRSGRRDGFRYPCGGPTGASHCGSARAAWRAR